MKKLFFVIVLLSAGIGAGWCQDFTGRIQKPVQHAIEIRQKNQKTEDRWAEEKAALEAEFEALQARHNDLLAAQDKLKSAAGSLQQKNRLLEKKIIESKRISDEILPFINDVFHRITQMVENDPPFLRKERVERLRNLHQTLEDPQATASEKFRRIMETLLVEAEYGNTVEVYRERISLENKDILANIFRLGRVSLFFQTLDRKTCGYFDPSLSAWKQFSPKYNHDISMAIEMGAKRRPVDLVRLPLGRMVTQ